MGFGGRNDLGRARIAATQRKDARLAVWVTFAVGSAIGPAIAMSDAGNVWRLSAVIIAPACALGLSFVASIPMRKRSEAQLGQHETERANQRAAETQARIAKAKAAGALDKWKDQ